MAVVRTRRVELKSEWPNEAKDFTPWLADHLDWLAEDIGLGSLRFEATEVVIPGGRSLDLLATDVEGRAVAIENQYGIVNHDHLTRGLAYAVALQAMDRPVSALIVIAEDHRDEFIAVADYLNECASARGDNGIYVFLVAIELEAIGESQPAVRFTAVAAPNDWESAVRGSGRNPPGDLAAFLAAISPDVRPRAESIFASWSNLPKAWIRLGVDSALLYSPNARARQGHCNTASIHAPSETFWLNRGRLVDSGAFDDAGLSELDRLAGELLPPSATRQGVGYYHNYPLRGVDPAGAAQLLAWVHQKLVGD